MTLTEKQQQDLRKQLVAAATLGLEEIPVNMRHAALLKMIEAYADELIRTRAGLTVGDFAAIFTKDIGLGPIGEEIMAALARLEAGAGAVEREALAALAKGTRPNDSDA